MKAGDRVTIPAATVPVIVQVALSHVTGIVVTDPNVNLHGQLLMVQLDPLPEAFAALRQIGMVDALDERVLLFPDEMAADRRQRTEDRGQRTPGGSREDGGVI